jgi:hypothetical protein
MRGRHESLRKLREMKPGGVRELRETEIFLVIRFRFKLGRAGTRCPKFSLPETRLAPHSSG